MAEPMQGRRVPDRDGIKRSALQGGGYCKVRLDGTPNWYVMTPNGLFGRLGHQHTVTEHEDGSITANPSILFEQSPNSPGWHGYLERGVWREV